METNFDKQEAFNKAYLGLKAQGFQKSRPPGTPETHGGCAYRGEGGMKCALGHLITDQEYRLSLEGKYARIAIKLLGWRLSGAEIDFLARLQRCHDYASDAQELEARLRHFASEEGLTVPA